MMQHEMENIKQLAKCCSAEAETASEVKAGQVRAKLVAAGGSVLAESPGLLHFLRFVLEQGGNGQESVTEPVHEYHEQFVNPRIRRLREHHFSYVLVVDGP